MSDKFKSDEIHKVCKKLIGTIDPIGSTEYDERALANLKVQCDLAFDLIFDVCDKVKHANRHENSIKVIGEKSKMQLQLMVDEIGNYLKD